MTLTFSLDENDYLAYQLFVFSRSQKIQERRQRNRLIIPLLYLCIGVYFWLGDFPWVGAVFCIVGAFWYFYYPKWEKKRYTKYYLDFVRENYYERFGRTVTLDLNTELIVAKDSGCESRIVISELKEIHEVPSTIFVMFKGGNTVILPKNRLDNAAETIGTLKEIARHAGAGYETHGTWDWIKF